MTAVAHSLLDPPEVWPRPDWGQCLFSGAAGILLFHLERAQRGEPAWSDVDRWARVVCRDELYAHPDACGLFRGVPAVAYALHGSEVPSHPRVLEQLDTQLTAITRARLNAAYARIERAGLPALREFDLIRGLTGLGVCAMRRGLLRLLEEVLAYLVELTKPLRTDDGLLPGWWTMNGPDDRSPVGGSGGHGNFGMAHGIAGPLALLAMTMQQGVAVAGQAEAIERIVQAFERFGRSDDSGWHCPGVLRRAEWQEGIAPGRTERPSWCYGLPGMIRALQLAAIALDDRQRRCQLESWFALGLADPSHLARLEEPFLCHGWAGLLLTARRIADSAIHVDFHPALTELEMRLAACVQTQQDMDPDLLEGRAGLELVYLDNDGSAGRSQGWESCLLIADQPLRRDNAL